MESAIPTHPGSQAVGDADNKATPGGGDSQRVLSNSLIVMIRQAFLWGLNGILLFFLPPHLGAEGMGQLSFMLSFTALVSVGITLGFGQYITKIVARDRRNAGLYLGASLGMRFLLSILGVAITIVVIEAIGYESDLRNVLYVGTGAMIALVFSKTMIGFMWGFEDMKGPARAEITGKVLSVAAGIPVLIITESVVAYVTVLFAANLFQMTLATYFLSKRVKLNINFRVDTMKTIFKGGLPFLMMVVILEMYAHADVIILRAYTNDQVTGWYGAALQFFKAAELFPIAITTALLPTLSRLHNTDTQVLAGIARKALGVVAVVVVPMSLALSLLSEQVITLMPYPSTFNNSISSLSLLALTIPITAFLTVLGTIAVSVDRQKAMAWALAATLLLDIILNIIFIPYFEREYGNGAIGAAITTLVAEIVMIVIAVNLMPPGVFDRKTKLMIAKILFSAGVLGSIGLMSYPTGIHPIATVILGGIVYIGLIFGLKVHTIAEVKHLVMTALGRRKGEVEINDPEALS